MFGPAAPGAAEDDGDVFAYVHNPDRGASDLVILATQDFTAEPPSPVFTCQPGSRPDSTATGSPTTITGVIGSGRQGRHRRRQPAARRWGPSKVTSTHQEWRI